MVMKMASIQAIIASIILSCVVLPYVFIAHVVVSSTGTKTSHDSNNRGGRRGDNDDTGRCDKTKKDSAPSHAPNTDYYSEQRELKETQFNTKRARGRFSDGIKPYRPHILFVVMDDLGSHDLGFHGTGIQTPVADSLVNDGLFLDDYYVHPICTPTRAAIMTGRYSYTMGLYSAHDVRSSSGMLADEETLPQVLKRAGYKTHAVGKWHLGHSKYAYLPTFRGFQSFFGYYPGGVDSHYKHTRRGVYSVRYDKKEFCGEGCSKIVDERGNYSSHVFARESIRVINDHNTATDDPLFLYLAFYAPHKPMQVPTEYEEFYKDKDWPERKKTYAGMVTAADEALGEVIASLKVAGLWMDTLVVYTSDNGASVRFGSNFPLREGKRSVYEGGVVSDGIIGGPAREKLGIKKGKMKHLFHAVDWLPTLSQIAGSRPNGKPLHGVSQLATLRGGNPTRNEVFLGFKVSGGVWKGPKGTPPIAAYRKNEWKLIYNFVSNEHKLFNLIWDPAESKDHAKERRGLVEELWLRMKNFVDRQCTRPFKNDDRCGRIKYVTTPWGRKSWIPWC